MLSIQFILDVSTYQSYLESVVLGESDDLHDLADPGEDLEDDVEGGGVDHVVDDDPGGSVWSAGRLVVACTRPGQGGRDRSKVGKEG